MVRNTRQVGWWFVVLAIGMLCFSEANAKKPEKPPGDEGSGGYTIVDLPGPYHTLDGWSRTYTKRISDLSASGTVYVLGSDDSGDSIEPCVWTIDTSGVSAEDLSGLIEDPIDINSAGIIAGNTGGRPMLLLADNDVIYLEDATLVGWVSATSNPDDSGIFQVVGAVGELGNRLPTLWEVAVDGTVVSSTVLTDVEGRLFYATDVVDSGAMAGRLMVDGEPVPALAMFGTEGLETWLRLNPNPDEIVYIHAVQLDDIGNLLGDGTQVDGSSTYPRAVIWPLDGAAIDLTAETGRTTTGAGIATVGGAMQVVGRAEKFGAGAIAYLYTNGQFSDLETMSKGDDLWALDRAEGINRAGMICGVGNVGRRKNRQTHGFLLVPNEGN